MYCTILWLPIYTVSNSLPGHCDILRQCYPIYVVQLRLAASYTFWTHGLGMPLMVLSCSLPVDP